MIECRHCKNWAGKKPKYTEGACKLTGEITKWNKKDCDIVEDEEEKKVGKEKKEVKEEPKKKPAKKTESKKKEPIAEEPKEEKELPKEWEFENLSPDDIYARVVKIFESSGLPSPSLAKVDKEDMFPDNLDKLTSQQLGQLMFKYENLRAFAAKMSVEWDIKSTTLKKFRDIRQGIIVSALEDNSEKKKLKDALESEAISADKILNKLVKKHLQAEANYKMFQGHYEIYRGHWETISREISRRSDEMKAFMREGGLK